jgi:hypothetical protein
VSVGRDWQICNLELQAEDKLKTLGRLLTIPLFLVAISAAALAETHSNPAFVKLKSLAGHWEGKDEQGNAAKTKIEAVVSGTAVMETLSMAGMEDMVTLYSADGDSVALVHYCPTNNQPRMRATPGTGPVQELDFVFKDAGNLATPETGHQHRLVMRFEDENHMTESWTWRQNGKDSVMTVHFTRVKKAN